MDRISISAAIALLASLATACEPHAALGAACARASDCAAPLACRLGRCRSECTLNRDCPLGTRCLRDADGVGACSVATDVCSASSCEGTLLCVEGACVNGCDPTAPACPADARCVAIAGTSGGVCDDTRGGDDAGARDGGGLDGGGDAGCGAAPCAGATAIAIGLGDAYTSSPCVVRRGGEVWCWGSHPLGDGDPVRADCAGDAACSPIPVRVLAIDAAGDTAPITGATGLAAGDHATCAIVSGGELRCWGETGDAEIPVATPGLHVAQRGIDAAMRPLSGVTALSLGRYTGFALVGGHWLGWGNGSYGDLADPAQTVHAPAPIAALDGLVAIAGGNEFACGLGPAGVVRCWGINGHGELGRTPFGTSGTDFSFDASVQDVLGLPPATAIASGVDHACALDQDGHAWCWGFDYHGALGDFASPSDPCNCTPTPVEVDLPGGVTLSAIASSPMAALTCGLADGDGRVFCWGESSLGEAGALADVTAPELPILLEDGVTPLVATAIAVGSGGGCAIDREAEVWCWGGNANGRLGAGTTDLLPHRHASRVVFP